MTAIRAGFLLLTMLAVSACVTTGGGDVDAARAADANAALGISYLRDGHYQLAAEKFRQALSYQQDHANAHWGLALVYKHWGEPDRAQAHFLRALDAAPRPEIQNSYGVFLCEQGRTEQAVEYFQRAASHPGYTGAASALANAGICLRRAGQRRRAAEFLQRALAREPENKAALAAMARLRYGSGRHFNARAFFQRLDAVQGLNGRLLLLAARNELALGHREQARRYLSRYNQAHRETQWTLDELANEH